MNRVYLVTGAGRGIGKAVARRLLSNGAAVGLLDVGCRVDGSGGDATLAETVAAQLGGYGLPITADVRDAEAVDAAIAAVVARWGRLDGVVNLAAILRTGNILTATDEDWSTTLDVNLRGSMLAGRAAVRHWVASDAPGRIVNVTSTAGLEGIPEMFAYSVSKAAVIGLTLATANAVASSNILVNAIAPLAATRMALRGLGDEALDVRVRTGSWPDVGADGLTAERVAPVAEYLLSPALAVTGRVFSVGAGTCARLAAPSPEVSAAVDETMSTAEVEALLDSTVAADVKHSRWQAATLPRERPTFPVDDLDA